MDPARFVASAIDELRRRVPEKALVAASGGIDSTVAAVLSARALGERARAVFVDTGLLRAGEAEWVERYLTASGAPPTVVRAEERFFAALDGVVDPEAKRMRIGEAFIRVFQAEASSFGARALIQGTIAPDRIESGDGVRATIKRHHNVGGVPGDHGFTIVEPLADLYKDEVRAIARHLGIADADRQPFPGPGLAVRVPGAVTPERVRRARVANRIVEEEVDRAVRAGEMERPWQYFAVLLPVRSVGVLGDNRVHGEVVSVRMVDSVDAMTATAVAPPPALLRTISERITRELVGEVVRVLYEVTDKPPSTIEWE